MNSFSRHLRKRLQGECPPLADSRLQEPPRLAGGTRSEMRHIHINLTVELRNINRMSIDYAFRPRLRPRLTLGGFTFPRKP